MSEAEGGNRRQTRLDSRGKKTRGHAFSSRQVFEISCNMTPPHVSLEHVTSPHPFMNCPPDGEEAEKLALGEKLASSRRLNRSGAASKRCTSLVHHRHTGLKQQNLLLFTSESIEPKRMTDGN